MIIGRRYISLMLTLLVTGVIVAAYGIASAADDDYFLQQQISVEGEILSCQTADFNGDGRTDIALVVSEPSGARTLKVYVQRQSGRFPPGAGQSIALSGTTDMAQCLDLDGDGRSEVVVVDNRGIWQYKNDGETFSDKPRALITETTVFGGGIRGRLLSQKFIYAVSGRVMAFLPVVDGYAVWVYANAKFRPLTTLKFPHEVWATASPVKLFVPAPTTISMSLPEIFIADCNGDDLADVYLLWPQRLIIFPQTTDGDLDNAGRIVFNFGQNTDNDLCQSQLIDFDLDGRLDLVCSRTIGGISEARTEIRFYGSSQILHADTAENTLVTLTDACGNLMMGNFDNQRGPELVVAALELGIMSTVKKMIAKKTDFHLLIYPIDNLGRPAKEPQVRKKLTCRLDFEKADPVGDFRLNWGGDYNGDGMFDLVTSDGGGRLVFYSGEADEYLEGKSTLELDIPDPNILLPVHLNADGRSDLVIIHRPNDHVSKITLLVTNTIG